MKKFLQKILIYSFLTLIIGNLIAFTANSFLRKSQFYKSSFLVNNFTENKKIDYFIAGSSRGLTTINSTKIDKELNLNGVNLSMDDTGLNSQFLMIQHFFESNFKAKYCILSLDQGHFLKTKEMLSNNDYRFVPFSSNSYVNKYYKKYDNSNLKLLRNANFNPFFTYSYYNLELLFPSLLTIIKPNYRNKFDEKGNYSYPNQKGKNKSKLKNIENITLSISNPLIKEIEKYLNKNNCELVIYIGPYSNKKIKLKTNSYTIINNSNSIKDAVFFYDLIHVNTNGRDIATSYFIDDFKKILEINTVAKDDIKISNNK